MAAADAAAAAEEDWQQQVDEAVALEAIYGSDFRLLSLGGGASSSVAAGLPLSLQRTYMQGAQLAAARRK